METKKFVFTFYPKTPNILSQKAPLKRIMFTF